MCSASLQCRSVMYSSRGETLPVRAARNSMADFISAGLRHRIDHANMSELAPQQALDKASHWSIHSAAPPGSYTQPSGSLRSCNTFAFTTLTPMCVAASRPRCLQETQFQDAAVILRRLRQHLSYPVRRPDDRISCAPSSGRSSSMMMISRPIQWRRYDASTCAPSSSDTCAPQAPSPRPEAASTRS